MSKKNKFIEGFKTIAGWAIFVAIIVLLVRSCGGEDEVVVNDDDGIPVSIVNQEQRDWYKSKLEEELYLCEFLGQKGTFGNKCGKLYTNAYYYGHWKDNLEHGSGVIEWFDGRKYDGHWVNGEHHGYGDMEWPDGTKYDGDWVNGQRHGYGDMEWPDDTKYIGDFKEGYREGFGIYEWSGCSDDANNKKYEGSWKRGDFHGQGTLTKCDDTTYEGNFKNDARHGRFKVTAPNEEMEVVYYTENKKVEEICEEIGFSKDSSKYEDCIIELVAETLSLE